jgi:AGCS family alanine or glycine:cation symporter
MVEGISPVLFFSINGIPLIVFWLVLGGIFFTFRMGFINIRAFKHSIDVIRGKYDDPNEKGEVTHFQALSAALSATVGLGNIAGVAIAIKIGGPGAVFWMSLVALFGMTSKFVECTLSQKHRVLDENGKVSGGPMYYLSGGLKELGWKKTGSVLAFMFAVLCIMGSFGGGNMFQANQARVAVANVLPIFAQYEWLFGLIVAILVGVVIIGGIKRIGNVASKLVPAMCLIYITATAWILFKHYVSIPAAFVLIFKQAFTENAAYGGLIGVLIQGLKRAAFSNEAGVGSAAIAHAAAKTKEPVREGIVAMVGPFIDTIVICNATALVVIVTGTYTNAKLAGVALTSAAFGTVISWFPIILSIAVFLFAFSTMISWSYYGERSWKYLFGEKSIIIYRIIFVCCVFIGSIVSMQAVIDFSDMMILAMAFPNILGAFFLSKGVAKELKDYMRRLKDGEFEEYVEIPLPEKTRKLAADTPIN